MSGPTRCLSVYWRLLRSSKQSELFVVKLLVLFETNLNKKTQDIAKNIRISSIMHNKN